MYYTNFDIAKKFEDIANLMEIDWDDKGTYQFRIRAYHHAFDIIKNFPENIHKLYEEGNLENIEWIWEKSMDKIKEYLETWTIKTYEKLKSSIPSTLLELLNIPWIWPKQAQLFYKKLWVEKLKDLEDIIKNDKQKILDLPRMWEKSLEHIIDGIKRYKLSNERTLLWIIYPYAQKLKKQMQDFEEVERAYIAWSLRRMKETIWDIDILVDTKKPSKTMTSISKLENIKKIIASWDTKMSVYLNNPKIQVDIRIIDKDSFGAWLQYFTWSKDHNIKLRTVAKQKWYKISEYGIYKVDKKVWWKEEKDIYNILWMDYIEPELRQWTWEIELAQNKKLPKLIWYNDLKWDLHNHTNATDGYFSLEEVVQKAQALGYEYIWISDHSKTLAIANWLDEKRVLEQFENIKKLRKKYNIKILFGTECDILADGSLDYEDNILKQFDYVIASIHSGYEKDATERYLKALDNPYINIIWHPTWKLIHKRWEINFDKDKVFKKAIEKGIIMEINSQPYRLDLKPSYIKKFVSMWWKVCINTDSHANKDMETYYIYGIWQARRAGLQSKDIINTYSYKDLVKMLNI